MEVLPGRARLATYAAGGADVAEGDGDRRSPAPIGHSGHPGDGERPEFTDSIKKAKLLIENQYERKLNRDNRRELCSR